MWVFYFVPFTKSHWLNQYKNAKQPRKLQARPSHEQTELYDENLMNMLYYQFNQLI